MSAATKLPKALNPELFGDIPVLQRKWRAAVRPGQSLPRYEEVMLGSLGRFADNILLLRGDGPSLEISRIGRYVQSWLEADAWDAPFSSLPLDRATALNEAAACALQNGQPYLGVAHCVREGLVHTYDVLALPTRSRWGGTLVGAYVNERGHRYNLLASVFASTDEGIISLATIRDAHGRPAGRFSDRPSQ